MNRRPIFKLLKDWLRPDIHAKVAKAKKRLAELERLLPPSSIPYSQRSVLDSFFCHVADLLSFGKEPSKGLYLIVPYTKTLCFSDFANTPDPFGLLADVVEPLMSWRLDPYCRGRKVSALRVMWLNIPHRQDNPFQEIGFFYAIAYSTDPMPGDALTGWKEVTQAKNLKL